MNFGIGSYKDSLLSPDADCKYDQVRVTLMEVFLKSPNILIPSQVVEINLEPNVNNPFTFNLASLLSQLLDAAKKNQCPFKVKEC